MILRRMKAYNMDNILDPNIFMNFLMLEMSNLFFFIVVEIIVKNCIYIAFKLFSISIYDHIIRSIQFRKNIWSVINRKKESSYACTHVCNFRDLYTCLNARDKIYGGRMESTQYDITCIHDTIHSKKSEEMRRKEKPTLSALT